ncbi:hypothetical protein [Candidatus Poriferisocius sp.]|uniref:hypothetical protein n=1 Tax=Candidatus Poriferisocius sp. TaxID=3101276 RepID=UPI003B5CF448
MVLAGAVVCLTVLAGTVGAGSGGVLAHESTDHESGGHVPVADVVLRDELVADQENLLNAYRCLFDVDTELVADGCPAGVVVPAAPPEFPTVDDVALRDRLVADQENLLNAYRCLFDVDTELVPDGCGEPEPPLSGGGTGWRLDGHGQPLAVRVWSQAETGSPWPPAGTGRQELDWMTRCMREFQDYTGEMVRRGWLTPDDATNEWGARYCSNNLSSAWGPVVLDGRDKACVYDKLLNRNIRTISGLNDQYTMWDCPTGPDGLDPDPLRPFEVRCRDLVARLLADGHITEGLREAWESRCDLPPSNPYNPGGPLPPRDPDRPCNSQRYAAKNLFEFNLRAQDIKNTTRYDWRPC